jgi:uncharacterized protein (DUF362 family)
VSNSGDLNLDNSGGRRRLRVDRRTFIQGSAGLLTAGVASSLFWEYQESFVRAPVFIAAVPSYEADLEGGIRDGLRELGVDRERIRGKSVMLKPNLVEPDPRIPHINTHPSVVRAAAEVFRRWDAREVFVAEGQGHCRDSFRVLDQSGLGPVLDRAGIPFVDLNHDDVFVVQNPQGETHLQKLYLPRSLRRADLVVSMPKMKTHHWVGVTLSMKNLFGLMPGICYGWPKNVLHYAGIPESILDIAAAVQPQLAIVDGVVGMEGDGPILGSARASGVIVMGRNLPAVDATASRLMGINPRRISYLARSSGVLGPIAARHIEQRGEKLVVPARPYELPPGIKPMPL